MKKILVLGSLNMDIVTSVEKTPLIGQTVFGTGLDREISGHFADTIDLINNKDFSRNIPIISVDTPSGLDSNSGKILGKCVKATMTATYGCAKSGQVMQGSSAYTGNLTIIDIGIPPEVVQKANIATSMLTCENASHWLQGLVRKNNSHKGTYGHLLILAGSTGKTGAAILAAKGALRSGCGLVSLCVPYNLNTIFETVLTEAMTVPLPTSASLLNASDLPTIMQQTEGKSAVVLGPGIGNDLRTVELVLYLYHHVKQPMIIDADALTILAQNNTMLKSPAGPRILTPHPGEMSRLINMDIKEILDNRLAAARLCYSRYNTDEQELIIILKGAGTLVIINNTQVMINTSGNPGMATGGMGDVLAGIIGSLICQGLPADLASGAAVYLHGMAGDHLYKKYGQGFNATELADSLPKIIKKLQDKRSGSPFFTARHKNTGKEKKRT